MLSGHAPDHRLDDLPQLLQADLDQREAMSLLRRVAARPLRLRAGAPAADGRPPRSDRGDLDRLHRALCGLAGAAARGHLPSDRTVLDPLARVARAVAARDDGRDRVEPGLVVDVAHRDLPAWVAAPHLLQPDVDPERGAGRDRVLRAGADVRDLQPRGSWWLPGLEPRQRV